MGLDLITSALFSVAGGIAGRNQGKKDQAIAFKRLREAQGLYGKGRDALSERISLGETLIDRLIGAAEQGMLDQERLMSDFGDQGYRAINDAHTVGAGRVNQSFLGRGFFGGSAHGGAFRALGSDVARSVGDFTSELASVRSAGLRSSLAQLLGAYGSGAQFQMGAGDAMSRLFAGEANMLSGVGHQPAQGVGAGWGTIGGLLGGALEKWASSGSGSSPAPTPWPESPTVAVPNPLALGF